MAKVIGSDQKIWRVNWRWANLVTRRREGVKTLGPLRHARWPSEADEKRSSLQGLDEDKAK